MNLKRTDVLDSDNLTEYYSCSEDEDTEETLPMPTDGMSEKVKSLLCRIDKLIDLDLDIQEPNQKRRKCSTPSPKLPDLKIPAEALRKSGKKVPQYRYYGRPGTTPSPKLPDLLMEMPAEGLRRSGRKVPQYRFYGRTVKMEIRDEDDHPRGRRKPSFRIAGIHEGPIDRSGISTDNIL